MNCPDCTMSAETMWHGFRSGCTGCKARAASRGPQFFESRQANKQTPAYRRLLDQFGLTHQQVLEARKVDAINRREPA